MPGSQQHHKLFTMAAAISLAASIVALVGAADAVGKTLSKARLLYRAPDELLALNNEISDLTVVMRNIGSHVHTTDPTSSQESLNHLKTLVERARDRILQLDQLIHYLLKLLHSNSREQPSVLSILPTPTNLLYI